MLFSEIIKRLGQPYYQDADCLIYACDCLDALRQLPDGWANLTVTSPPYNIGKAYEDVLPLDVYLDWCAAWIQEVYRVTAANGAFWLNLGYLSLPERGKAIPIPYLLWDRIPFYLMQEIVWHYEAGVAAKRFFAPRNEKFLWYIKDPDSYTFDLDAVRDPNVKYPNQKKNGKLKVNPNGKNPGDVWAFAKVTSGQHRASPERTAHPAQFPEAVIERIVRACSSAGEIICDPFLGSGTTALTALQLGRKVIGFELKPEYCEIAVARVQRWRQTPQQIALFEQG